MHDYTKWVIAADIPEKNETTMTDARGNRWVPEQTQKDFRDLEQKSYRAGWKAGSRQADQTVLELRKTIERNAETFQKRIDVLEKENFDIQVERAALLREKQMRDSGEDLDEDGADCRNYAERPLTDDDKHWLRQRADRAATKALLDKPYWAEGLDPDEV